MGTFAEIRTKIQRNFLAITTLEQQLYPRLRLPATFRTYAPSDFKSCVEIYRENENGRFPENVLQEFEKYLKSNDKTLIIAEVDGEVVGYGGINLLAPNIAVPCFGIIARKFQKQRIGATLLLLRMSLVPTEADGLHLIIFAVPESMPVYERFGFVNCSEWLDAHGTKHPIGVNFVPTQSLMRIRYVLEKRGILVDGEATLRLSKDSRCKIVVNADGNQEFEFEMSERENLGQ